MRPMHNWQFGVVHALSLGEVRTFDLPPVHRKYALRMDAAPSGELHPRCRTQRRLTDVFSGAQPLLASTIPWFSPGALRS